MKQHEIQKIRVQAKASIHPLEILDESAYSRKDFNLQRSREGRTLPQ